MVARVRHVEVGVELPSPWAVHAPAVAQAPGVFPVGFDEGVRRGVDPEVVVLERRGVGVAIQIRRGVRLFRANPTLHAKHAPLLTGGEVRGENLLVVAKLVVDHAQRIGHVDAINQTGDRGLGVLERRDILVPSGLHAGLELAFVAPRPFEIGLRQPPLVVVRLFVERRHCIQRAPEDKA